MVKKGNAMKQTLPTLALGALLLCAGCLDRTVLVDTENDAEVVAGLDYKDFETAAAEATQAILGSAKLRAATPEGRLYVVSIGKVVDATPLGIDTDLVTARVTEALLNDERFVTSAVFADSASNRDETISDARAVRGNAEFDQSTVQKQGTLKAPDFSLTGKIVARDVKRDNGGHQYEYYFQLRLNDLKTGTVLMSRETRIVKRTGEKGHTW